MTSGGKVTGYYLLFDNGNHEDRFDGYPPDSEIAEARAAAPDAWTHVDMEIDGWDREEVASWPPLEGDPRAPQTAGGNDG